MVFQDAEMEAGLIESDWNLKFSISPFRIMFNIGLIESDWNLKNATQEMKSADCWD